MLYLTMVYLYLSGYLMLCALIGISVCQRELLLSLLIPGILKNIASRPVLRALGCSMRNQVGLWYQIAPNECERTWWSDLGLPIYRIFVSYSVSVAILRVTSFVTAPQHEQFVDNICVNMLLGCCSYELRGCRFNLILDNHLCKFSEGSASKIFKEEMKNLLKLYIFSTRWINGIQLYLKFQNDYARIMIIKLFAYNYRNELYIFSQFFACPSSSFAKEESNKILKKKDLKCFVEFHPTQQSHLLE